MTETYWHVTAAILTIYSIAATIIISKRKRKFDINKISLSQSSIHNAVKDLLPTNSELRGEKTTQASINRKQNTIRVVYTPDQKAYWVKQNTFYCADLVNGELDPSSGKPVITEGLSKQEIQKLLIILDNLNG